jgi:hypothetical protein
MTTFSQLVDEMVIETRRPDLLSEIATYLNQTIREVHFEPSRGNVVFFNENRKEYEVSVTTAVSGQTWDTPNPSTFQGMEAVQFPNACAGRLEYAKERRPGPGLLSEPFFYYRAGMTYVFGGTIGYGGVGSKIRLSYFRVSDRAQV